MFSFISDEVRDDILEHLLLSEVLVLQAASPALQNRLQGACGVIRICLEEASCDIEEQTPTIVDMSHGTDVEEPLPPTSFLNQPWSRKCLTAKVALAQSDYEIAARELLVSMSRSPLMPHVRKALGATSQLVRDLRIERWLDFPVPAGLGEKIGGALLAGQILGLAGYEHHRQEDGWAGTSIAWIPGEFNNSMFEIPKQVKAYEAKRWWDIRERSGFNFADVSDRLATFGALPAIGGIFEEELSFDDLAHLSDAARNSLRQLGRLRVPSVHALDSAPSASVVRCPHLQYLSIQLECFSAGTSSWPVLQLSDGTTQPVLTAERLALYLSMCFPRLRSAHVFITWDVGWHKSREAPNFEAMIPQTNLVDLTEAFLAAWSRIVAHDLDITTEFKLWNHCFDGVECITHLCSHALRQAALEAYVSYLEEELFGIQFRRSIKLPGGCSGYHRPDLESRDLEAAAEIRRILTMIVGRDEANRVVDGALGGSTL